MSDRDKEAFEAAYEVGYGKPPAHSRFRPGTSGNPAGRPPGTGGRAKALVLEEAYRLVTGREGAKVLKIPAIQAVLRTQFALAAQGNGPAQRAFLAIIKAIEQELAEADRQAEKPVPSCIKVRFVEPNGEPWEPAQIAPGSAKD